MMKHKFTKISPALFLLLCIVSGINGFGQSGRKNMADKYYGYLDYSKAAPIYSELADKAKKGLAKGKSADWDVIRRAAETNYYIRKYGNAVDYYSLLDANKTASVNDYKMYFEALRYTGDYKKANMFLDSLNKMEPDNKTIAEYKRLTNYYEALKKDSARLKVSEMPFNKGLGDFGPAYYQDGIVYASNRRPGSLTPNYGWDDRGFLNVFYSEGKDGNYGKKGKLVKHKFKTSPHDGPVFYDKEGKTAYITRNRTEKDVKKGDLVVLSLYIAEKGSNGKWGTPQPFQYNSKLYSVGHACLSPDGKTLYFASDMPGSVGGVDIWSCEKVGGGWGTPKNLGKEINTTDDEMFPWVSPEGNMYFASKGHVGLGGHDIFEARKSGSGFMAPINMGYPINTQYDDFAMITEKDGKKGFFSSDRSDYIDRIYGVDMDRIILNLEGIVTDQKTGEPIPNARVVVRNNTLGDSIVTQSDSLGRFASPLHSESDYTVSGSKKDYTPVVPKDITTKGLVESKTIKENLDLIPGEDTNPWDASGQGRFVIRILNCTDNSPIVGLPVTIQDMESKTGLVLKTDEKGRIIIPVSASEMPLAKEYAVIYEALEMDAKGVAYRPSVKKLTFILKGTETELSSEKQICLEPMQEGDDIVLEDIYYDFDKSTLRPISVVRLNKAYDYLMRNPNAKLQLSSHTDCRASYEYNISLSERRAKACVDYLTKVKGVPASRLSWKGYGETRLVNGCSDGVPCSEEQHQMNRRTEIRVIKLN